MTGVVSPDGNYVGGGTITSFPARRKGLSDLFSSVLLFSDVVLSEEGRDYSHYTSFTKVIGVWHAVQQLILLHNCTEDTVIPVNKFNICICICIYIHTHAHTHSFGCLST